MYVLRRESLAAADSDREKSRLALLLLLVQAGLVLVVRLDLLLRGHLDLAHVAPARVEARAHLVAFLDLIQAGLAAIARDRRTVGDLQLLLAAGAGGDLQGVLVLVDLLHHAGELAARARRGARPARSCRARRSLARARGRLAH